MQEQLLLFQDPPEIRMQREIDKLNSKHDKLRKAQFSKLTELEKLYKEVRYDLDFIKAGICKNNVQQMRMF